MRRIIGPVLAVLGGFLLVLGLLAQFYAPSRLMKTPIDVDSNTHLSGTASLSGGSSFPVLAWSITKADSEKSDGEVVVFANSSCLVKDEGGIDGCVSADDPSDRLLSASTDNFATDRVTALAVNDPDYLPADAEPHEGLINKWPFEAEQETYPYWDGTAGQALDAVFDREEEVNGLKTYVYKVTATDIPIEIADGVPGTYSDVKEIYIDTVTGSIIHQTEQQLRNDADGNPALELDLSFTEDQVQANVDDAEASGSQLNLVRTVIPIVGYVLGIPALLLGLFLIARGRRESDVSQD